MKDKIKLRIKKICYCFDYHLGYFFINGRKYDSYLKYLVESANEISILEDKIKNKN